MLRRLVDYMGTKISSAWVSGFSLAWMGANFDGKRLGMMLFWFVMFLIHSCLYYGLKKEEVQP